MRQTIRDIEVNPSYRWFLGLSLNDKVSHFTTYGKNYNRRFQDKEVIEEFFHYVLSIVWGQGLIDPTEIFIDGTHIKATANNHKYTHQVLDKQARFMSEQLEVEIDLDRKITEKSRLSLQKKARLSRRRLLLPTLKVVGFTRESIRKCSPTMPK